MSASQEAVYLRQELARAKGALTEPAAQLADALFADAADDELAPFPQPALARLAAEGHGFLARRKPGEAAIRISPAGPGLEGLTRIETANDDMPFLVDSLLGLLTERGHEIRLVLHPVLSVERDGAGALQAIRGDGAAAAGALRESYIIILTGALAEAEARHLHDAITAVLADVRAAVTDWTSMQARLRQVLARWRQSPPPVPVAELAEAVAFLEWLLENHFTFLGLREIAYRMTPEGLAGEIRAESGLGILRDSEAVLTGETTSADGLMRPDIAAFLAEPELLIIGKADRRASVHRRAQLDYVGVKLHDETGRLTGELRLAGLYTSAAYTQNPGEIPLVRRKIAHVIAASGFAPMSHSGKALQNVLETWPRDELLQMPVGELEDMAHGILKLEERPRPRLFCRRDRFDRFVSAFVFVPRDRFSTDVRIKVGELLARAFEARPVSFAPSFRESALVRVHYVLRRNDTPLARMPDGRALEAAVAEAVRNWADRLGDALTMTGGNGTALSLRQRWAGAFPLGYTDSNSPEAAITDLTELDRLEGTTAISALFQPMPEGAAGPLRVKLYRFGAAIPLSQRVPILENMGLKAIEETSFTLTPRDAAGAPDSPAFIHEVILAPASGSVTLNADLAGRLAETFLAVWNGLAENDAYNSLVLQQPMGWRQVALLRAIGRYLRQAGIAYSNAYVAASLVRHSAIAEDIFALFAARFDQHGSGGQAEAAIRARIEASLSAVQSLDEDRILRRFIAIIDATLRTTYFAAVAPQAPIALKLDSRRIEGLPEPRPFAEIFVYSPAVEGVHLRNGRIARGGIRWSDRPEDFRTEVLGLVKAQNVKNAVIVPVGAKGGFVPKRLTPAMTREEFQAEGIAAYKSFISSLLALTDNLDGSTVLPPAHVVHRDGDDPYLVVAADKGTATFSDTANALAEAHHFWLGDAFASGGSAGYDHKKMGITARGAFEAVARHFREVGMDVATTPFTAAGVGDMSGDVFGNGMLLSRAIRLVAAFDHRDIFIDPDPDAARSYDERARLFALPRSSWQDYSANLISDGGGVYARSLKTVPLSEKARKLLGLGDGPLTPADVMSAILKAPVDLLWFGGIGTYVRAASESNAEAGDKANDTIRITAADLKARVIGEGANLALTQRARIDYALAGGRINTDAVDNSAGVNSSDYEVNIKIALGAAIANGSLAARERNGFLAGMTDEVAALVLRNNKLQTLCLSLAEKRAAEELGHDARVIARFEARGELDRRLEFLPDAAQIRERERAGRGLTRPELAVLMAYAKLILNEELMAGGALDDPYLDGELLRYFPAAMTMRFTAELSGHRLRREIIATMLANSAVNRLGPSYPERICEETGASASAFIRAFLLARDSFGFSALNDRIDALGGAIDPAVLSQLQLELQLFIRRATVWFLRNETLTAPLGDLIAGYRNGITAIRPMLAGALPEKSRARLAERTAALISAHIPDGEAGALASLRYLQRAPDIVQAAAQTGRDAATVARVLFASSAELGIDRLVGQAARMPAPEFYDRLAVNRTIDQIFRSHRAIVASAVALGEGPDAWRAWTASHAEGLAKSERAIAELASGGITLARLMVAASELQELAAR